MATEGSASTAAPIPPGTQEVPKPEKVVPYVCKPENGALMLFGDTSSPRIALVCAGFADDHTVFLPFAKSLSESLDVLVGVMCLPGYDDRPEDEVPWTAHQKEGYSFDEMTATIREGAKALIEASTCDNGKPEFTGIFHDWAVFPGTKFSRNLEAEAEAGDPSAALLKPDKIVFVDVLLAPPEGATDIPENVATPTIMELICTTLYKIILAVGFVLQWKVHPAVGAAVALPCFLSLEIFGLGPLHDFDIKYPQALYEKPMGLSRILYMAYPYWNLLVSMASGTIDRNGEAHHGDWKAMPILYLYGRKKKTNFHNFATLAMLEREEAEGLSLSKVVAMEEVGHYLYLQKPKEFRDHVVGFMTAENTFASAAESSS
mmetsp:Transcript_9284/g.19468  ORF Transcript_9284/g.19468 Transcript_9284/m.19468 type:complete len:374 (+) Transcript_9284:140-1261(+)